MKIKWRRYWNEGSFITLLKKIVGTLWKHIKSQGEEILADIYTDMDWVVCYK